MINKYTHYGKINIYDDYSGKKIYTYEISLRQTPKYWIDDFGRRYEKKPNSDLYYKHCSHIVELVIDSIRQLILES